MRWPLEFHRDLDPQVGETGHLIETFTFKGIHGQTLHGWYAYPQEVASRLPAFLWVPPYGQESVLPNKYGTREGMVSLSFNFHGHPAFYQRKYVREEGYFSIGGLDPHTWKFKSMYQNAVIALRVLRSMPEVDEDRLASCGMSQGAGISIWLGAWCSMVKAVCADMPFLGGLKHLLSTQVYRYPLKELVDLMEGEPLGEERLMHTLAYFDTLNQAQHCKVPTLVSLGEKDPAVRPIQAQSIYKELAGIRKLIDYPGGHDWDPAMVQNNLEWLTKYL